MKKSLLLNALLAFTLVSCACHNKHASSYSALMLVRNNTDKKASCSFKSLKGTIVFHIKYKANESLVYTCSIDDGKVTVYYDTENGDKTELFTATPEEKINDSITMEKDEYLYILFVTDGECKSGSFSIEAKTL